MADIAFHLAESNNIDVAIGMSPTEESTDSLSAYICKTMIYTTFSEAVLQNILDTQARMWKRGVGYRIALFLDDCVYDKKILKTKTFRELMMNGRHRKITLILAAQYCMDLPPSCRSNIDIVVMARDNIKSNQKKLYEQFAGFFETQADFNACFAATTTNYEVLVIDNKSTQSNDLTDNVKWYKARNDLPPFRLGKPWVWELDAAYFCDRENESRLDIHPPAVESRAPVPVQPRPVTSRDIVKGDVHGRTIVSRTNGAWY